MSRTERPSGADLASESESARPRTGSGFEASNGIESIRLGCSMLSKLRFRPRNLAHFTPVRCALGYALHGMDDVAKCLAVEGPNECWKMVPNWRVAALERQARQGPETEPDHDAPHVVELEEASTHAAAGPVSGEEIALAEETLQRAAEPEVPIEPGVPADAGEAGIIRVEAETDAVLIVHLPTGTDGETSD